MEVKELISESLEEDLGSGDITTDSICDGEEKGSAQIIAKEEGVLCGAEIVEQVFLQVDKKLEIRKLFSDGDSVKRRDVVIEVKGSLASILKGERVALNFLQRMSGITTKTAQFAKKLKFAKVYDTRKTTPLLRDLEKYAVKIGGGENHRFGLFDQILIKENHIETAGGITKAISKARGKYPDKKVETEVKTYYEFMEALGEKADIILLDNMNPKQIRDCLKSISEFKPEIEVSGGVTLETVERFDIEGVDRISVGSLTHSVRSLDFSLLVKSGLLG